MEALFKAVEERGEDFSEQELKDYDAWDEEVKSLTVEIEEMTRREARHQEILEIKEKEKAALAEIEDRQAEVRAAILSGDKPLKDTDAKVTAKNLKSKEARNAKVFKMLNGLAR